MIWWLASSLKSKWVLEPWPDLHVVSLQKKIIIFFDKIINTGNQDFLSSRTMIDKYLFGKYFFKKNGREWEGLRGNWGVEEAIVKFYNCWPHFFFVELLFLI